MKLSEAFAATFARCTAVQLALSHLDNVRMQITGDLIRCVSATRHGVARVGIGTSGRDRADAIVCVSRLRYDL